MISEGTATMRLVTGLLVGLMTAGLVGCSITPGDSSASLGDSSASPAQITHAATQAPSAPAGPREPRTRSGARAAAMHFYGLYQAGQFAAAWNLLEPTAQRHVPQKLWVQVHEACAPTGARAKAMAIKAVTIFGNAAIITQRTARDIFSYAGGHWAYSPSDLSIYGHGSATADVAAAKAAGLCHPGSKTTL
jgi:hypothetical protein